MKISYSIVFLLLFSFALWGDSYKDAEEASLSKKAPMKQKKTFQPVKPTDNTTDSINPESAEREKNEALIERGKRYIEHYEARKGVKEITKQLLHNTIPEVRAEAARALGRLRSGLKALHIAIDTDGYEVRQNAYQAIELIGSPYSIKYFIKGIQSSEQEIRISSYKGLGKTKTSVGRDLIVKAGLKSPDPPIVAAALEGLGYFSKSSDLQVIGKYLESNVQEYKTGAIRALANHGNSDSLKMLWNALIKNPELEPDIIYAVSKKRGLAPTLMLIKIMNRTKNENYQNIIHKELVYRRAYGKYAIVQIPVATLKQYPRANSTRIARLGEGDVGKVRRVTSKRFKAKFDNKVIEDRYYLIQAVNSKKNYFRRSIMEGWVFGPKIKVISISPPTTSNKLTIQTINSMNIYTDEHSEEEIQPNNNKKTETPVEDENDSFEDIIEDSDSDSQDKIKDTDDVPVDDKNNGSSSPGEDGRLGGFY